MSALLVTLYCLGAGCELAGVALVVVEVRQSRRAWDHYKIDNAREREALASDPLFALDSMNTRYGFSSFEVVQAINAVRTLTEVSRWRQNLAVSFLLSGILIGLAGNLLGIA